MIEEIFGADNPSDGLSRQNGDRRGRVEGSKAMNSRQFLNRARTLLGEKAPVLESDVLRTYVSSVFDRRQRLLACAAGQETPLWIFDPDALLARARQFTEAFAREIPDFQAFFAIKSNNHPLVARTLVRFRLGLDVSSGRELEDALSCGCRRVVFSGPGKTDAELDLAVEHRDRVTVLLDSFGELERLERVARRQGGKATNAPAECIDAGVRLTTQEKGLWKKFGIPVRELNAFLRKAEAAQHVNLCGLQFHTSWNLGPAAQVRFLQKLGYCLGALGPEQCGRIEFIDIGGGYWPPLGEWVHRSATPQGRLLQALSPGMKLREHCRFPSQPIDGFARKVGQALRANIFPHVQCRIFAEPGRWLVNDCMHLLVSVVDKKARDVVIADAGTNNIGWERYETDYVPVLNLSRPSLRERRCLIFGSLCTPHDVWGYSYFGQGIEAGDVLLIPDQGAYTYSLRQQFIKPLAETVSLR